MRLASPQTRTAQLRGLTALAAGLAAGGVMAALWYIPNWETVYSELVRISKINPIGFDVFDANAIVYYLNILILDQIGLPFMAIFIVGLVSVRRHVTPAHFGFLVSWVVGLYAIATLAPYKGTGQDVGILIPVSVISAIGLIGLARFRQVVGAAVLAFALIQAIVLSLPVHMLASRIGTFRWAGTYQRFPETADWQIPAALRSLGTRPAVVKVLSDHMYVNGITVQYYARREGLPLQVVERYAGPPSQALDADVVITKSDWSLNVATTFTRGGSLEGVNTASLGVMYTRGTCATTRSDDPFANLLNDKDRQLTALTDAVLRTHLPYIRSIPLPDGSALVLYAKQPFVEL